MKNSVVSKVWASALAYATLLGNYKGRVFRESNKQRQIISHKENNHVTGMLCVNTGLQPTLVGHNPGIYLGFQTFATAPFNKEATSQSVVSTP